MATYTMNEQFDFTPSSITAQIVCFTISAFNDVVAFFSQATCQLLRRIDRAFDWSFEVLPPVLRRMARVLVPRPPSTPKLAIVACWASFLLATTCHADTGSISSGGLVILGTVILGAAHAFQGAITSAVDVLIAKGAAKAKALIASSGFAKDHPNPAAAVQLALGDLASSLATFFNDATRDLTAGTKIDATTLANVKADAKKDFLSRANELALGQALSLGTGGIIPASALTDFLDNHADAVISMLTKAHQSAKVVLTTADGAHIVAPAPS